MNRLVWVLIFVGLIAAGPVTAQEPAKSGGGSRAITGLVFGHNGQPLAGGQVSMQKVGGGMRDFRSTFINEAGEFRFDNLSRGAYMVFTQEAMEGGQRSYHRPGDFVTLRLKKGGVITGTVTDSTGEPVIAVKVHIVRVRDEHGRRTHRAGGFGLRLGERSTDDRGVYRVWGLPPGSYLVSVGGRDPRNRNDVPESIGEDAPTYHPSAATPEVSTEVSVNEGGEATGIDIRHRGDTGHTIRGHISGRVASSSQVAGGSREEGLIVTLTEAASGALVSEKGIQATEGSNSFLLENVADGEYDLTAHYIVVPNRNAISADITAASPSRRVIVKSKDVTGVEMKLSPLGSIEGRVVPDADRKQRCQSDPVVHLDETVITVAPETAAPPVPIFTPFVSDTGGVLVVPDQRGDFAIRSLQPARYRVEARLLVEHLYIRSISLPGAAKPGRKSGLVDAGSDGIAVKSGERVTGLTITLQEGAASVRGRVVMAQDKATLRSRLRVHLVPAEQLQRDDVLRFAEARVESDGSFVLTNIAPGRYWLLARAADDLRDDRPLSWDGEVRAKLIQEAKAANTTIELQPCQRIGGHMLRYAPLAATSPKKVQ